MAHLKSEMSLDIASDRVFAGVEYPNTAKSVFLEGVVLWVCFSEVCYSRGFDFEAMEAIK